MEDFIDSIIDYLSDLDMPIDSELIEHSIEVLAQSAGCVVENTSELVEKVTTRLAEIGENLSQNADMVQEGVSIDSDTDLSSMFNDKATVSDSGNDMPENGLQIPFTGATTKDLAFQEFKQILSANNQSIPYSITPNFIGDSIGPSSASNLRDYVRNLFRNNEIEAATESKLLALIDKML